MGGGETGQGKRFAGSLEDQFLVFTPDGGIAQGMSDRAERGVSLIVGSVQQLGSRVHHGFNWVLEDRYV
ncbi:hypothetical protein D3C80_1969400 [compost metagenome]